MRSFRRRYDRPAAPKAKIMETQKGIPPTVAISGLVDNVHLRARVECLLSGDGSTERRTRGAVICREPTASCSRR